MVGRGFSGYNSQWCRIMLPRIITTSDASSTAAVVICLGANDSNRPDLNPRQHVPLDSYRENIVAIVKYLVVSSVGLLICLKR